LRAYLERILNDIKSEDDSARDGREELVSGMTRESSHSSNAGEQTQDEEGEVSV
jgi:hypothetical protein